jgi:NDP-sugar pyrophosphorylase family protein
MRAVIIATGEGPDLAPLTERYPAPLLPLVDRPFIQHVIEFLVGQGVLRFDLVLSHLPEKVESFLGDGKRWGGRITYHLARDASRPYRLLRALSLDEKQDEPFLLGHADRLPQVRLGQVQQIPVLFCCREETDPAAALQWTGWALLPPQQVAELPVDVEETGLANHLMTRLGADGRCVEVPPPLSVHSCAALLRSHRAVLNKECSGLLLGGRETSPGIWFSRNVVLHPTARIVPPVYFGENCQVGAGARLGPHAVIGHDCVLDTGAIVSDSVLFPGGYVGEGLELVGVIVDKNRLVNPRLGGAVTITDDFILANLTERRLSQGIANLMARVVALAALLVAAPVLLVCALVLKALRTGPVLYRRQVVRLPAAADERSWRTYSLWSFCPPAEAEGSQAHPGNMRNLLLRFLPGLVNIVKGDLGFVGVPARSADEIKALSHDWQTLYLRSKAGLVTEAAVRYPASPTEDERYAAEGFYAVTAGWLHDLKLLLSYLGRCLFGWLRRTDRQTT